MLDEVLGNETLKSYFAGALAQKTLPHACLFAGEKGSGRKTLVKAIAAALFCESEGAKPCGKCHACLQMAGGNLPDLVWVTHEKPASIGVDDVRRQLVDDMGIRPYSSPWKLYIVDEAELMTQEAQNAMLKTIEEPPEYGLVFLLTANEEALLPTVRSRCARFSMAALPLETVQSELHRRLPGKDPQQLAACASFARGNLGRALQLADSEEFAEVYGSVLYLLKKEQDLRLTEILDELKQLGATDKSSRLSLAFEIMELWFRDVVMFKASGDLNRLVFTEEFRAIRQRAQTTSYGGLQHILEALDRARARLRANVNRELLTELLFLTIKEEK